MSDPEGTSLGGISSQHHNTKYSGNTFFITPNQIAVMTLTFYSLLTLSKQECRSFYHDILYLCRDIFCVYIYVVVGDGPPPQVTVLFRPINLCINWDVTEIPDNFLQDFFTVIKLCLYSFSFLPTPNVYVTNCLTWGANPLITIVAVITCSSEYNREIPIVILTKWFIQTIGFIIVSSLTPW